jgi:ATP-binding cassette subfamily F protein uup
LTCKFLFLVPFKLYILLGKAYFLTIIATPNEGHFTFTLHLHMNILSVEGLTKTYGERTLFNNITFGISQGDKIAMVARNGSGKTTLMKIIMGKDNPDQGRVVFRNGLRIGYLDQNPEFNEDSTIEETIFNDDNITLRAVKEYEHLLENQDEPNHSERLQDAMMKIDELNAWDFENNVKIILGKLDIHDLTRQISELSGGQRKRVALAKLLIDEPDLILMDEPTNHLDLEMIEWLENYLTRGTLSLLMVTHDRYFLDNVCSEIIELDRNTLFHYKGDYEYFIEKKAERELALASEIDKAKNTMRKELEWIRRMPKARGTKSKSRIQAFEDIKKVATQRFNTTELTLNVKMSRIGGKVLEMKKVAKAFGEKKILTGFDYTFNSNERIGIVGKNGIGKSTFLNMIMGLETPDSGKINHGDTIVFGYYSQGGIIGNDDKRIIEVVKDIAEVIPLADGSKLTASQFLNLFQFPPDMQYNYVGKLSGGEKRRLYLLTVLIKNPNFLILDEPTNDLDLITLNILEDFLMNFSGCVIIVSHDRYFMDRLVDHLFIFEGEGMIKDFNGNYTDYRIAQDIKEEEDKKPKPVALEIDASSAQAIEKKKGKVSYKEKLEFETIEKDIASLEAEKQKLTDLLATPASHTDLQQWSNRISEITNLLDEKGMRWLELSEMME